MPKPGDLLTEKTDEDPDDELRMQLDQGQGNNLAGGPQPPQAAFLYGQGGGPPQDLMGPPGPPSGPPQPPSPNVPGPLAALPKKPSAGKPKIKLLAKPTPTAKPHIKLKSKKKPHFRLRATNV